MQESTLATLAALTDAELMARTRGLMRRERRAAAELVHHLAEVHRRRAALAAGYPSLYAYCRDGLGMSDDEAYNRAVVAEAGCRCPAILAALAEGEVSLTAVRLVAPHLTHQNAATVLASIRGRKRAEIDGIVAALAPRPDTQTLLRRLPTPASVPVRPAVLPAAAVASPPPLVPAPAPTLAPTSPGRFRLQISLDAGTAGLLRELRELMRHTVPTGDEAEIVRRALVLLHAEIRKQRFAAVEKPRPVRAARHTDGIPADVRRRVWARDGGRCAFVSRSGHRCGERAFLQFHHRQPRALGGPPTLENIALRCRAHNQFEAEVDFGLGPNVGGRAAPAVSERRLPIPRVRPARSCPGVNTRPDAAGRRQDERRATGSCPGRRSGTETGIPRPGRGRGRRGPRRAGPRYLCASRVGPPPRKQRAGPAAAPG